MYVTKYALTKGGVEHLECKESSVTPGRVLPEGWYLPIRIGEDAFEKLEDAQAEFEKQRVRAIKSAEKRLNRLLKLNFKVKEA